MKVTQSSTSKGLRTRLTNHRKYPSLILDGGMGTSLNKLGLTEYEAWGSPRMLSDAHIRNSVKTVHRNFLESGVDIITTNTYDSSFTLGLPEQNSKENQWVFDNIDLAKETIDEFMAKMPKSCDISRPLLAMSVSSVATILFGRAATANREQNTCDDYARCPGYGFKESEIVSYFNVLLTDDILRYAAMGDVSILAFETIGDLLEVEIICDILKTKADILSETALSTWVTLTCPDEKTVDTGDSVTSCIEVLAKCPQVTGVGINCTEPHLITPLIGLIKQALKDYNAEDKLIVVYPNSGETYISDDTLKEGQEDHWKFKTSMYDDWNYADAALEWIKSGVHIVGGCCRITADNIAELVEKLQ